MKTSSVNMVTSNKNIVRIVLATAVILLVPLVAMQFTDEVAWNFTDFVVVGSLLIGTGLVYELATRKIRNANYRTVIGITLVVVLLLVWVELAVGIFGTPFAGS
jgi:hypothetical protein